MFPKGIKQQPFDYIHKELSAIVHEKRITALFLSTLFKIIQHHFSYNTGKQSFCAPDFLRVRIIFLKDTGMGIAFRCRSPPLISILPFN